jgi:tetracycline 7-halogenase / FADH2 O2-dependent halogenase
VQAAGLPYYDRTELTALERRQGWLLQGQREGEAVKVTASFLIDATGPGGVLARALGIDTTPAEVRTNSWSVFSHFADVGLFEDVLEEAGDTIGDHPYRCDDAAVHHLLEDGWVWVLRFNNGVTSAGVLYDGSRRLPDAAVPAEIEWERTLQRYPSLGRQFAQARPVQPWVRTGRLQRRARRVAGEGWVMLSHAAYFLDALFSAGNAHSLLSIQRLGCILKEHWGKPSLARQLADYETRLLREADFLDRLIHGCYRAFGRFEWFAAYVMYYFAGAMQSEARRRQGATGPDEGFLFSHHPPFHAAVCHGQEMLLRLASSQPAAPCAAAAFQKQVAHDVAPYNSAGLCDPGKRNMYPFA